MLRILLPSPAQGATTRGCQCAPATSEEATDLLGRYDGGAKVLAGGIDLIAKMRRWQIEPRCLVSIRRIPGLGGFAVNESGELSIGPMVSLRALELSPQVREGWPVLHHSITQIASVQVKTMGTVIGNLCVATPASDVAVALYVLDARLTLTGSEGQRTLPIEEFFVPVAASVLQLDEIVTELVVPPMPPATGAAFQKLAHTKACIAKVNAAALVTLKDDRCSRVRIALGAVGPTFIRARRAEDLLEGASPTPERINEAAEAAASESQPQDDLRSSADYRRRMVKVLTARALSAALDSARKEG